MVNYQQGKIYKIVDNTNGNVYIGSTCKKTLAERLSGHKARYNAWKLRPHNNSPMTSFKILENMNYDIMLIENYPCKSKDELFAREAYHINTIPCINKEIPKASKMREKYDCPVCGAIQIDVQRKTQHEKSKFHNSR